MLFVWTGRAWTLVLVKGNNFSHPSLNWDEKEGFILDVGPGYYARLVCPD
jgi:hypothetical protein